jgi:3-dehydroquinate synthase
MTEKVHVALGERSYDVHIGAGLLDRAGELLAPAAGKTARAGPLPVVTDQNLATLHYPRLAGSLEGSGFSPAPIVLPAGEQTKSFVYLEQLIDALLALEIERGGLIVAFGGGVIGDLTGFAAGVLKRGIAFAQLPTTLLSQVDSSVGGKTAINTPRGKNLVGVFHQPRIVIADIATLETLPKRELLGGYAEVMKYGLLGDPEFFSWLESNAEKALAGDQAAMARAVTHSVEMKAGIVGRDEREQGERALLNLGHTFGHALEAATGYADRLTHGEGVALGCVLAFKLSTRLGLCPPDDAARVEAHLSRAGFRTSVAQVPGGAPHPSTLLSHMRHDKKASGGRLTFILARGIGKAFIAKDVKEEDVLEVLKEGQ